MDVFNKRKRRSTSRHAVDDNEDFNDRPTYRFASKDVIVTEGLLKFVGRRYPQLNHHSLYSVHTPVNGTHRKKVNIVILSCEYYNIIILLAIAM
jgi:hypothetical protein